MMTHASTPNATKAARTTIWTAACLTLLLTACTTPSEQLPPPPPASGNLFLVVGGSDLKGLHVLDTATGAASVVGGGFSGITSTGPGLAPTAGSTHLFGSDATALRLVNRDGSGWDTIGGHEAMSEGLAYDAEEDVLYSASNGYLHVRSPVTGETLETWLQPPNEPDIEGLAFDPDTRTLYGLARGFDTHPDDYQDLYALEVDAPITGWRAVGSTGGLWASAGLAFDLEDRVLYALGRQDDPGGLYLIDPLTAATSKIGDTGLPSAAGGLAWVQ